MFYKQKPTIKNVSISPCSSDKTKAQRFITSAGKELGAGGHQAQHEPATYLCSKEGQQHPGRAWVIHGRPLPVVEEVIVHLCSALGSPLCSATVCGHFWTGWCSKKVQQKAIKINKGLRHLTCKRQREACLFILGKEGLGWWRTYLCM